MRDKSNDEILPSSVEEGMPWPQAVAGVVRPARVPTTPCWLAPAPPLLIQGGEFCLALMSLFIVHNLLMSGFDFPIRRTGGGRKSGLKKEAPNPLGVKID